MPVEVEGERQDKKPAIMKRGLLVSLFIITLFVLAMGLLFIVVKINNEPPIAFPVGEPVSVATGMSGREITELLEDAQIVRSATLLYLQILFFHDTTNLKASTYVFPFPLTSSEVAARLTEGDFENDLVKLTHIEGERVSILADRASLILSNFNKDIFIEIAEPYEGRLFPETYLIPYDYSEEELLELLTETFASVMAENSTAIEKHSLSLDEIIILASIIEREANSPSSMKMVSGILQNRLAIDMALQADASIEYVLDRPLSELTPEDLQIDSPYNTYLYTGLPPTPIGNPGLDAIMAVLEPVVTDYYYYITDDNGDFHYAKTYDEHRLNIERYLQ